MAGATFSHPSMLTGLACVGGLLVPVPLFSFPAATSAEMVGVDELFETPPAVALHVVA